LDIRRVLLVERGNNKDKANTTNDDLSDDDDDNDITDDNTDFTSRYRLITLGLNGFIVEWSLTKLDVKVRKPLLLNFLPVRAFIKTQEELYGIYLFQKIRN